MLYGTPFQISEENLNPLKTCNGWIKSIIGLVTKAEFKLQNEKDVLIAQLREIRKGFGEELNAIDQKINKRKNDSEKRLYPQYISKIAKFKFRLEKAVLKMEEINEKEILLGRSIMDSTKLDEAKKTIEPFEEL